jgi:hypothetical protein
MQISRRMFFTAATGCLATSLSGATSDSQRRDFTLLSPSDAEFGPILAAAIDWAEPQEAKALAGGRVLSSDESEMAKKVGVREVERVRILTVDSMPFPESGPLLTFLQRVGVQPGGIVAMTAGHGIFLRREMPPGMDVRAHEFRHVAQHECFGSIRAFVFFYLREMLHFPHGTGPLEIDADHAAMMSRSAP